MKSLKNLFKEEDFFDDEFTVEQCAQRVLDQYIEENGVKVYCSKPDAGKSHLLTHHLAEGHDTHSAILLDIQPLKQCEHKEAVYVEDQDKTWFKCRDCGKPVKAKGWESV